MAKAVPPAPAAPPEAFELPGGATVTQAPGEPAKIDCGDNKNPFQYIGGSSSPAFNSTLLRETLDTLSPRAEGTTSRRFAAAAAALAAFKPADEIEGMLAGQAVALHFATMECLRRAMLPDQPSETASKLRKDGANMARAMTDMLAALDAKRGKGSQQLMRIERVVVHEGGRAAIVGNVQGSDTAGTRPAPHAAIGQEQAGITVADLIGKQPELVEEGGV